MGFSYILAFTPCSSTCPHSPHPQPSFSSSPALCQNALTLFPGAFLAVGTEDGIHGHLRGGGSEAVFFLQWAQIKILTPLGPTEASVEGWPNEITLSNWNSSFAAVMSQPCSPWGADAEGGLEWPCSLRHISCRPTQIHSASLKSCRPLLLQFPLLLWT